MDIGINLAAPVYWSVEAPFIDRFHLAGDWVAKNASGNDVSSTLKFNAHGDVTNLTGVSSLSVPLEVDPQSVSPSDEYILTYDGTANVSIALTNIVSQSAGKVVFDFAGGDKNFVSVNFTGLDPNNPVGNVHLVRADQVDLYNSGEIFNPAFIDKVSQWSVVRFMDWGDTNASESVSWASRTTLDSGSWAKQTTLDGVPIEAMVKLANEAHVDMWYNVPTKADDAYVTQALTYIRDHLDPTLKVHVEWSNEVWNAGFDVYRYAQTQANALWGNGTSVANGNNVYYGYRSAQIASIAHNVYGDEAASRLVDVLAGQAANSGLLTYILQGVNKAGLGTASSLFHDYAIAPYFGGELGAAADRTADRTTLMGWVNSGASGVSAAFHELEYGGSLSGDKSLAVMHTYLVNSAAAAHAAGLDMVAYEGGASLITTHFSSTQQPKVEAFFAKLLNDPRMGDLYSKLLADFKAVGGGEFTAFNDTSGSSPNGYWGVLDSIYDNSSPRYDALLAAAHSTTSLATIGNDLLSATALGGPINSLGGDDVVNAGIGNDTIDAGDGNDLINGSSNSTDAKGNLIEKDYYYGGAGSDTINGGIGNDHIYGTGLTASPSAAADGADSLNGGDGRDFVYGGNGDDTISGGNDNDYLQGDAGNDLVLGDAGNDTIRGGLGNDTLLAGSGDDQIRGDKGYDLMTGAAGNDVFVFAPGQASFVTSGSNAYQADEITDFTDGADKISLGFVPTQILHGSAATISDAATWAAQTLQTHAGEHDVAAVSVGSDTYLFYDDSGNGGALNAAIHLDQIATSVFTLTDFV